MKVVHVHDFGNHAAEIFRSDDVILVTHDGVPAGFFLPWDTPGLPVELCREVFARPSEQVGAQLTAKDVSESAVLHDFAASLRSSLTRAWFSPHRSSASPDDRLSSWAGISGCGIP